MEALLQQIKEQLDRIELQLASKAPFKETPKETLNRHGRDIELLKKVILMEKDTNRQK